eukprot:gene1137-1152_t
MKVVIAPDSFKGSISNFAAAKAIAKGWLSLRPDDQVFLTPMADGGEGTLETIAASQPDAIRISLAMPHSPIWLLLLDGTAVVELASICGITLLPELNPMHASTYDLGIALHEIARDPRVERIVITVGGSASTDGGAGALVGLGARLLNEDSRPIALGGSGLLELATIDLSHVVAPPRGGVTCLKGANPTQVAELEAGGTPYGLSVAWDISLSSGALAVAKMIGLENVVAACDLVITGEGRLDSQSNSGKVVGTVEEIASRHGKKI